MKKLWLLLVAVFGVLSLASAQEDRVVISPQSIVVNPRPGFEVDVWVDKAPARDRTPVYQIGEDIEISVRPSEDAYVYLFNVNADDRVTQILPNRLDDAGRDNFVRAGRTKVFPPSGARYRFEVRGPAGLDKVIAVASRRPLDTSELVRFTEDPNFASARISEQRFAETLSIVVRPLPQDDWVASTTLFYVGRSPATPEYGTLNISSTPSDARAYVDGRFVGYTPVRFGARSGRRTIRIERDGYETFETGVNLRGGETLNISTSLDRVRRTGTASFTSEPRGAEVRVGGEFIGTTPTGPITFEEGNYQARFSLPNRDEVTVNFSVSRGGNQAVRAELPARLGTLVVHGNVSGARVFINGREEGSISGSTGRVTLRDLPTGRHELTVVAPGYRTVVREFDIRSGATTEERVSQSRM